MSPEIPSKPPKCGRTINADLHGDLSVIGHMGDAKGKYVGLTYHPPRGPRFTQSQKDKKRRRRK
jgi:hypothetical protein